MGTIIRFGSRGHRGNAVVLCFMCAARSLPPLSLFVYITATSAISIARLKAKECESHLHKNVMIMLTLYYKIHFDVICSKVPSSFLCVRCAPMHTKRQCMRAKHKEGSGCLFHYFYTHFFSTAIPFVLLSLSHSATCIDMLYASATFLLSLLLVLVYWNKVSWEFTRFISAIIS